MPVMTVYCNWCFMYKDCVSYGTLIVYGGVKKLCPTPFQNMNFEWMSSSAETVAALFPLTTEQLLTISYHKWASYDISAPTKFIQLNKTLLAILLQGMWNRCSQKFCNKKPHVKKMNVQKCKSFLITGSMLDVYRDMHCLTTGIRSEKCVVSRCRHCANAYLHKPRKYSLLHA